MDEDKDKQQWINVLKNTTKHCFTPSTVIPPKTVIAKGDSAASNHYWRLQDMDTLTNVKSAPGPTVTLPNLTTITSTQQGQLPLSQKLSHQAKQAAVLTDLHSASLISFGQLCDDNCKVLLDKKKCYVMKDQELILQGTRNYNDGLWDITLPQHDLNTPRIDQHLKKTTSSLAVIIRKNETKTDLATYLHAACFSPVVSTFIKAINNNHFTTWPGLTAAIISKYLPASLATAKAHINQERQKLQSTKQTQPVVQVKEEDSDKDAFPTSDAPNLRTQDTVFAIMDFTPSDRAYIDLTGRFPYTSSRGNQYILIGYHYDANAIIAEPLKSRQTAEITKAWSIINEKFTTAGVQPHTYVIDNEASTHLKAAMTKKQIEYQLVPPHNHRANLAERAIQTFKKHFKAGLATCNPLFPLAEWDRLLDQANITINMLRSARVNPKLSAYAYVFGEFNFSATPLAPPGTKVVSHHKPDQRKSWGPQGIEGWYVGPSMEHYRCVKCFFPTTRSTRDTDTVTFFPTTVKFPAVTSNDFLHQAATDIITLLTTPTSTTTLSLQGGDTTRNALLTIAEALHRSTVPLQLAPQPSQTQTTATPPRVVPPLAASQEDHEPPVIAPPRVVLPTAESQEEETPQTPSPPRVALDLVPLQPPNTSIALPRVDVAKESPVYQHTPSSDKVSSFKHQAARHLLAQHLFHKSKAMHVYNAMGKRETIDTLLYGINGTTWTRSLSNEFGRLAQGNDYGVAGTDTIDFIRKQEVPTGRNITYASFVCDFRPLKTETHRIRLVVGGDKLSYDDDAGAPAASLLETKLLINSVISDAKQGARFCSYDLKDFFLATPMTRPEFMKIPWKYIPEDIRRRYQLYDMVAPDGHIYVKIKRGMYGLKQAAVLAYDNLVNNLSASGYSPVPTTIGMWKHNTRQTKFCLCVDDFGIKYYSDDDAHHLLTALQKNYAVTVDKEGKNFCGLKIDWHYDDNYVDINMPNYVSDALHRFQHPAPVYPQYSPHQHNPINYGERRQYAAAPDQSELLDKKGTTRVQSVVGTFLYYARAIDSTMLPALNEIASQQAAPTTQTLQKCNRLLDYVATYPNAYIRFHASDMILMLDTDAAYLVMPKARSRIAGYYYLGNKATSQPHPELNGAILIECKTLRHVVASAAEAETGGIFHNAQMAIPIRTILEAIDHPQPPTPITTDNSTATGFVYNNINQKKSKSWDMRYYWLRDRENQKHFKVQWERGIDNDADYFTKHHSTKHHREMRSRYVKDKVSHVSSNNSDNASLMKMLHETAKSLENCLNTYNNNKGHDNSQPQCKGVLIHGSPGSPGTPGTRVHFR